MGNSEVRDVNLKEKAWKACKDFISGPWSKITLEEFQFSDVKGGLSNTLYRCALPENVEVEDTQIPKQVLLRMYGPLQDDPNAIVTEAVTFMMLSERKLGPKLYGCLPKGRLEEFIPSHSLSSDEMRSYSHLIAREMAKIHALNVPVRKVPDLFQIWSLKWLGETEEVLEKDKHSYMSLEEYKKEIEWLTLEMAKTNSPIVYCHNDLQGGNVLYREDATQDGNPSLLLIDFEFGTYNYRGFDFANHFAEWCFDYNTEEFPHFKYGFEKFPSREEQINFFTAYLDQMAKEGVQLKRPQKEEIESMLKDINLFCCAVHLLWSVWCVKMTGTSSFAFAFKEHAKIRIKLFHLFKDRCLQGR